MSIAIVDISGVVAGTPGALEAAALEIGRATLDTGFFYISGHGVSPELTSRLETAAREFFALPTDEKAKIAMLNHGKAWRGWFRILGELTSGVPDCKEGIYFGEEQSTPAVEKPMHGPNAFPETPAELKPLVLEWMRECDRVGRIVMSLIAVALGLPQDYWSNGPMKTPFPLFRIFNYPPVHTVALDESPESLRPAWGVAEHTDYGCITLLWQDSTGGLEVKPRTASEKRSDGEPSGWISAKPIPGTFVCNIGDMLEAMSGGLLRSGPHRVALNTTDTTRISMPFFYDPGFDVPIAPLELDRDLLVDRYGAEVIERAEKVLSASERWDGCALVVGGGRERSTAVVGTYGAYIQNKVARVFPDVAKAVGLLQHDSA